MADYEKLDENRPFFTGATSGQLYLKFLAYQGLDSTYSSTNKPAISLTVEGEERLHSEWNFNPKRLIQVDEVLTFIYSRASKVKIHFRDPISHQEIGTSTIEPSRLPNAQLATLWFKIHDTAKILVRAYWSALESSSRYHSDPQALSESRFTLLLDRTSYLPGETLTGVVVYRPNNVSPSSHSLRLVVNGTYHQMADNEIPYDAKHVILNHEAILLGNSKNTDPLPITAAYYIWTFNFPLPYYLPPSCPIASIRYSLKAHETGSSRSPNKSIRFRVGRVFYPQTLLEPAVNHAPGAQPANPATPAPASNKKLPDNSVSCLADEDEVNDLRHSSTVLKLLEDSESMEESVEKAQPSSKTEKSEKSEKKHKARADDTHDVPKSSSKGKDAPADASDSTSPREKSKKKKHSKKPSPIADYDDAGSVEEDGVSADEEEDVVIAVEPKEKPLRKSREKKHGPTSATASASGMPTSAPKSDTGNKARGIGAATAPQSNVVGMRLPARVKPGLAINPQPSNGVKHLTLPIELENTTNKPLVSFSVAVRHIDVRTFKTVSLLAGTYESSSSARYHVLKQKFKNEPGWPLAVGQKWSGVVTLTLSETSLPSVTASASFPFSRTYYAKVHASAKGVFTKNQISKKSFLLVGSYDWNTRPLPIQHSWNTPIRFTVFTLPSGPIDASFHAEYGTPIAAPKTLDNLEQSEAVDLEASTMV